MEKEIFTHYKKLFKGEEQCEYQKTIFNNWDFSRTSFTKDKAISVDLISDVLIQKIKNPWLEHNRQMVIKHIVNFINEEKSFKKHLIGRLILINKVHPKTPEITELRPIAVLSPIRKFLELQLTDTLQKYLKTQLIKS